MPAPRPRSARPPTPRLSTPVAPLPGLAAPCPSGLSPPAVRCARGSPLRGRESPGLNRHSRGRCNPRPATPDGWPRGWSRAGRTSREHHAHIMEPGKICRVVCVPPDAVVLVPRNRHHVSLDAHVCRLAKRRVAVAVPLVDEAQAPRARRVDARAFGQVIVDLMRRLKPHSGDGIHQAELLAGIVDNRPGKRRAPRLAGEKPHAM